MHVLVSALQDLGDAGVAFVFLHVTSVGGESRIWSMECPENRTSQN
jgi:hypothetical protein